MTREEWIKAVRSGFDVTELYGPSSLDEFAARFVDRVILPALPVWQPIETAPRNCAIIMTCKIEEMPDGSRFVSWVADGFFDGDDWCFGSFDLEADEHSPPTHWQPLPTPPEGE